MSDDLRPAAEPPFSGFPGHGARYTAVPDVLFARLLREIEDAAELRALLFVFWRARGKRPDRQYVTLAELAGVPAVLGAFGDTVEAAQVAMRAALEAGVRRGTLLEVVVETAGGPERVFFVNAPPDAERAHRLRVGDAPLHRPARRVPTMPPRRGRVLALWEARFGLLTPEIARELSRAARQLGETAVVELLEEAAPRAERPWSYVRAGLDRLATTAGAVPSEAEAVNHEESA